MKSNWILGGEFTYIFGNRVKNQETLFSLISNSDGFIIDNSGEYAEVVVSENGFNASLKIGKIFPWFGPNKNCGPVFSLQPGFFQHKVKILNIGNTAPQLRGDYKKGYDELANGFSITEFIGYFYMGNRRLVSFYAGFEFTQAFTSNRRPYSFNNMERTGGTNLDLLYSVRIGWMIPIYKRAPAGYYY